MTAGFQLGVIGSLTLSVASSVSIVICNKALISTLGFPFGSCLISVVCNHGQNLNGIIT
jgi:solute carrier family 35 protein E3